MSNLSIEDMKERKKAEHKASSDKELKSLNSNLDTKITDALLPRNDRDSLMPPSIDDNIKKLKQSKELGYSASGFSSSEITKMTDSVDNYKTNVATLKKELEKYNELDISVFSKLNHLEDVQAILRTKTNEQSENFLPESKIKKATSETTWLINNIENLKKVEESMENKNPILDVKTSSTLKIKKG
jgi:hypothetical protein